MFAIWASHHLKYTPKEEEMLDLGVDVTLGEEVQELIAAQTPPAPEPPPPEPPPPPPEPTPEPEPEPPPEMEKPEFIEPKPEPKATPAPKQIAKQAPAPPGAKTGPTPRPGMVGGNVTQGQLTGTPGGQKVGNQGWRTPRPSYPTAALASHVQGSGSVRISTDGSGNVVNVVITGPINPLLDANTRTFARANWKGPPNSTRTVPVVYQIR
jgi:protein TonB